MAKERIQAWLYPNMLSSQVGEKFARVQLRGSADYERIVSEMKREGVEFQDETLRDIIQRADRIKVQLLLEGYSVHTDFCHARLSARGSFVDGESQPSNCTLSVVYGPPAQLRRELAGLGVDLIGEAQTGPLLLRVVDDLSGEANSRLTPGNVIHVYGDNLYLREGSLEADEGLFFVALGTGTRTPATQYILCKTKELIVMVPALAQGDYQLELATRSGAGGHPLKELRSARFDATLSVL